VKNRIVIYTNATGCGVYNIYGWALDLDFISELLIVADMAINFKVNWVTHIRK
jgi:hypothetical protein